MFRKLLFLLISVAIASSSLTVWADEGTDTRPVQRLGTGIPTAIAASPDGKTLAVGASIGVWFLDADSLAPLGFWDTYNSIKAVNFSADGRYVKADLGTFVTRDWFSFAARPYTAGESLGTLIYDVQSGSVVSVSAENIVWLKHECSLRHCAKVQLNSEKRIVSTSAYDVATNQIIQFFQYPTFDVSWSPDSAKAYAVIDAKVQIWDVAARLIIRESNLFTGELWRFVWSDNGGQIASGHTIWNVADAQVAGFRACTEGQIVARTFACNWPTLVSSYATVTLNDAIANTSKSFVPHHQRLYAASLSRDEKLLVTTGDGIVQACRSYMPRGRACPTARSTTRIWDLPDVKLRAEIPIILDDAQFNHTADLVIGFTGKAIEVWDWATSKKINSIPINPRNSELSVSPVASLVAITRDEKILLYRFDTGELLATFVGHTARITQLAFSPNGKQLAASSLDGTILIWNIP